MNTDKEYDVVIVGSGIAGAVMAKTLTQAGKTVLLLEAGLKAGINMDKEGNYQSYMDYLNTYYTAGAKVPNSPYPSIKDAPSISVLDIGQPSDKSYLVQQGPLAFGSDSLRGPGGTTLHWLGSTPRMLPNDFQMQTLYKQGVDWPFTYDKLEPYYEMAELEIGVAGNVDAIEKWPKGKEEQGKAPKKNYPEGYVFPMEEIPVSYLDDVFTGLLKGKTVNFNNVAGTEIGFSTTPQGRNSIPNKTYPYRDVLWDSVSKKLELHKYKSWSSELNSIIEGTAGEGYQYLPVGATWDPYTGQRCEGNASCVPICPVQAKYNALKTLYKCDKDNLTIKTQSVASRVLFDKNGADKHITGIEYKTYSTAGGLGCETHIAKGKIYVLGASAIENAKILLASEAANSSDQVGRNLMDHLCLLTWGLLPKKGYPFRGPGSTTNMSSFRDGSFREKHTAWICPIDNWGWGWPKFSPESDLQDALNGDKSRNGLFGKDLREHLADRLPKQLLLHYECEQIPDPENRITINDEYRDQIGNHRPVINYDISEYIVDAFKAAKALNDQIFKAADVLDRTEDTQMSTGDFVVLDYKPKIRVDKKKCSVEENKNIDKENERRAKNNEHKKDDGKKGYNFWGAGHIVGTHRMGKVGESVVDENCRTWDHNNLYLVGCGSMPTLGTSNPTLTMTALTFKAAEAILNQLSEKTI